MPVADITTVANATAAAHGYALSSYSVTSQGQLTYVAKLSKWINQPQSGYFEFMGIGAASVATTAQARALNALNANRRHRYSGAPGITSPGPGPIPDAHGDTHTVDVN